MKYECLDGTVYSTKTEKYDNSIMGTVTKTDTSGQSKVVYRFELSTYALNPRNVRAIVQRVLDRYTKSYSAYYNKQYQPT